MLEAQTQQHLLGLFLTTAATEQSQMLRHLVVTVQQLCVFSTLVIGTLGNLGSEPFLLTFQVIQLTEGRESLLEDCADSVGHHLLRQISHRLSAGHDEGAAFWFLPAAENL